MGGCEDENQFINLINTIELALNSNSQNQESSQNKELLRDRKIKGLLNDAIVQD